MSAFNKPPIHLWIYNHPFHGISDQVEFLVSSFKQNGYSVSVGRQPSNSSLNVVIENFSTQTRDVLIKFCMNTRKRVAIIMTEHLDFDSEKILFHGDPLWSDNDYMHPATQVSRIRNLMDCLPSIRCFFVLGDLPELRNMSAMLPGVDVRSIPFPKFNPIKIEDTETTGQIVNDLLFTGVVTDYRSSVIALLKNKSFSIVCPQKFVSRKNRDTMNRSAMLILNIPQRKEWRWLSLMRIVAALRCGRATVSLGTNDNSKISACCYQLDISNQQWLDELRELVSNWVSLYKTAYDNYILMAEQFESSRGFQHDMLEFWAITDLLVKNV